MIVGIDGNEANTERKVGVHQMTYEILLRLSKLQDNNISFVIYLKSAPREDMPPSSARFRYKVIPGSRLWVFTKLTPELFGKHRPDVFFTPSHYLPIISPVPAVCMITDLGYLEFSGQFRKYDYWQLVLWTAISLMISKYIIAISETTKKDIVRHYKFASNKIKTIYLGGNHSVTDVKINKKFVRQILDKYRITKKYIVFVSTLKPGKNVEGLIEGFNLINNRKDYQLVIAGKKGWLYDSIFKKVKKYKLEDDVVFTDYLPETEKPVIISGAKVLVLPSFWEGFGIDILNAFALGVPVVASNIPSLVEVAGQAGIYIDPNNIMSIRNGIESVIKMSQKEYNEQVEMGFKQLKKFSWDKCARETLEVLKSAYKK